MHHHYDATTTTTNNEAGGLFRSSTTSRRRPWWLRPTTWWLCLLTIGLVLLVLQVQWLQVEIQQQQDHMEQLTQQVQTKQQDQIQQLTQQVQKNQSYTVMQMGITLTLLTGLITMFHMTTHLRNYAQPIIQRKVLVILWMTPIYSVTSCLSLLVPALDGYLGVVKDFYEAYVIYNFLSFLILVLGQGNRAMAVQVLAQHADKLPAPTRLLRRYYDPPPELSDAAKANAVLTECQILCLQFVLIRPLTALMHLVLSLMQEEQQEITWWQYLASPSFAITMLMNVSVFFAFRGLLKFYHACEHDLQWLQPFAKFMSIKGVVFLTFWQGLLISVLVHMQQSRDDDTQSTNSINTGNSTNVASNTVINDSDNDDLMSPQEHSAQIQNVLICLEMLFFSIAHWCVFPWEEWQPNYRENNNNNTQRMATPGFGIRDFVSDMSDIVEQTRRRRKARRLTSEEESDGMTYEDYDDTGEEETAKGDHGSTVTIPHDLVLRERSSGDCEKEEEDVDGEMI